jgi:AraC-like DNA-binding protein
MVADKRIGAAGGTTVRYLPMVMPTPPPFRYAERRPAEHLLPWVRNYWWMDVRDGAPPIHHVPPDGSTALVLAIAGQDTPRLHLSGPWLEPLAVPVAPGHRFAGIRLQPGALGPLLGLDPTALRDRSLPAEPLLGDLAVDFRKALDGVRAIDDLPERLTALLERLASRANRPDPLVSEAVARLITTGGETPIGQLARHLGTSPRTLHRRFVVATGVAPKQFARIRRLLEAAWARTTEAPTWGRAAHVAGYADQPHLHRDVTGLTGLTPQEWQARLESTEHDQVDP